jgi:tetratricopeptide (TPR) repeat protein
MRHTASHGFREVDTWPVDARGTDLTRVGNHLYGPVSLFAHGSREGFMGVYHPWSRTGVVHYSGPEDAPTKKIWSWGGDADGLDWRKALSDDQSAYVEIQAGLFRDQETYGFLAPQETIRFVEYWQPVRGLAGITRANPNGVVYLQRSAARDGKVDLSVGLNVTRALRGRVVLNANAAVVESKPLQISPDGAFESSFKALEEGRLYTLRIEDEKGAPLIEHTEGALDVLPASEVKTGRQPVPRYPPPDKRSEGDTLALGVEQERDGKRLIAFETYGDGLRRFPESLPLLVSRGRMAVDLQRHAEASALLERARLRSSSDPEILYPLAIALAATGKEREARTHLEAAQRFPAFRAAAGLELSRLDARQGRRAAALARLQALTSESKDAIRAGALEVALLRALSRDAEARARLRHWLSLDPTSNLLRHEAVLLGTADDALWSHLATEPERVLDVATEYMGLGLYPDAVALLERRYVRDGVEIPEPGSVLPQEHPLVGYYRGYVREKNGASPSADFEAASKLSTRYVFPSRADSFAVLRRALERNATDATARFLIGSLYMAGGEADPAIDAWEQARRLNRAIPVLHRNLGIALLQAKGDAQGALAAFREGIDVDRDNAALYFGADQAASLTGASPAERVALLERYPDRKSMPAALLQKLALALVEVGRGADAEALFQGRFFPREEGGTNVRQVFLEVRLQNALALAKAGKREEAARIADAIGKPVKGLAFTEDGLEVFVNGARFQLLLGDAFAAAGRTDDARQHWQRAREARESPLLKPALVAAAERRLGVSDQALSRRSVLEDALAAAENVVAQGQTPTGATEYAWALTLRALGREQEAREHLRKVLLLPDVRLSHFLARRALEANEPL